MSKRIITATAPDGTTLKRSTHRHYVAAVAGQLNLGAIRASYSSEKTKAHMGEAWDWTVKQCGMQVSSTPWLGENLISEETHRRAVDIRNRHGSKEAYIKALVDKYIADHDSKYGALAHGLGPYEALSWSGRLDLAAKDLKKWRATPCRYINIVSVPVNF